MCGCARASSEPSRAAGLSSTVECPRRAIYHHGGINGSAGRAGRASVSRSEATLKYIARRKTADYRPTSAHRGGDRAIVAMQRRLQPTRREHEETRPASCHEARCRRVGAGEQAHTRTRSERAHDAERSAKRATDQDSRAAYGRTRCGRRRMQQDASRPTRAR